MRKLTVCTALTVGVLCTSATAARAAEIRVLASTGIQVAVEALKPQFEKATGDTLSVDFSTTATLRDRIEKGEAFDVAILTDDAIDALIKSGALDASTRAELARVGIGVAYRKGAPAPKVKTAGDLKQALVNAKSVAYTGNGATRPAIEKMFDAMGIADVMKSKANLTPPASAPAAVAQGKSDLVISLVSEFVAEPGVVTAGMLPPEYQSFISFAAAKGAKSTNAKGAESLIKFMDSKSADATYKAKGMEAK
jgi:molybdate transport system substrate-binding protein